MCGGLYIYQSLSIRRRWLHTCTFGSAHRPYVRLARFGYTGQPGQLHAARNDMLELVRSLWRIPTNLAVVDSPDDHRSPQQLQIHAHPNWGAITKSIAKTTWDQECNESGASLGTPCLSARCADALLLSASASRPYLTLRR